MMIFSPSPYKTGTESEEGKKKKKRKGKEKVDEKCEKEKREKEKRKYVRNNPHPERRDVMCVPRCHSLRVGTLDRGPLACDVPPAHRKRERQIPF